MIKIGIDQSIGFTGVTVIRDSSPCFYGITHKAHQKWDKLLNKPDNIKILDYKRIEKSDDYVINERVKYLNIREITRQIREIFNSISNEKDDVIVMMEGVSFSSRQTTALVELSALNYMIRELCDIFGFEFIIVPPTSLKKFATGNGQADKDLMVESFLQLNPDLRRYSKVIKIDDIADSYFLASYTV